MKIRNYIALSVLAAAALSGCTNDENNSFGIDNKTFTVEAVGGTERIRVSSNDSWVASASVPWITVSPANGKGSKECRLIIDSALTNQVRSGVVRITKSDNSAEYQEVKIEQKGFDYGKVYVSAEDGEWIIYFQNENLLITHDGAPVMTVPDITCYYNAATGEPLTNADIAEGMEIVLGAIKAPDAWWKNPNMFDIWKPFLTNVGYEGGNIPFAK